MAESVDRELLRQQRKERKKEKKEAKKLEKQQEKEKHLIRFETRSTKVSLISSKPEDQTIFAKDRDNFPSLNEKGLGRNKHVKSKAPTQISLDLLIKDTKQQTKQTVHTTSKPNTYIGNKLDASQPVRYQGKHHEGLEKKKVSKLKADIVHMEEQRKIFPEQELITYCDNLVTDELKDATADFIKKIVDFQEKAYLKNIEKSTRGKRRYIVGFHEVKKYLMVKKLKCLIIADDIKIFSYDDPLYVTIQELIELAKSAGIPYLYALKRSKIGNLTCKHRPVSCVGVLNQQSAEEELSIVLRNIQRVGEGESTRNDVLDLHQGLMEALKE